MKHLSRCVAYLVLAALALMIAGSLLSFIDMQRTGSSAVVLRAGPWGPKKVQLFYELREGPDVHYATFADGTRCTKMNSSLYKLGRGDTALYFYRLQCGTKFGYVHADQVSNY